MKIAYVIDRLGVGGAERVAVDLANLMSKDGQEVTFVTITEDGPLFRELDSRIAFYDLRRKKKFSPGKMRELSRVIDQHDVVHVHMRHVLKYICLTKIIFPFHTKIIFHDHYGKIDIDYSIGYSMKFALGCIDAYIGVDQKLCDWARSSSKIPKNRIWKLTNIVLPRERKLNGEKRNSTNSIIVVSNFKKEKNIEFAIRIFEQYVHKHREGTLDIYGQIVDKDYYDYIKKLVLEKGLKNRVSIITDCSDPRKYLYKYDLALHTAISESGPLVLIEYLFEGIPFVSFHSGEVANSLSKHLPLSISDNWDIDQWITRIELLQRKNGENIKKKFFEIYQSNFSPKEYLELCKKIYKKSLDY